MRNFKEKWQISLRKMCPNKEFFLVCILLYSVRIRECTDEKKLRIWTLFNSVYLTKWYNVLRVWYCNINRAIFNLSYTLKLELLICYQILLCNNAVVVGFRSADIPPERYQKILESWKRKINNMDYSFLNF